MGNRRRTQTKRKHAQNKSMECEDDLQCEDDLSHAAQFAILPSTTFNVATPAKSDPIEENKEDLQDIETDEESSATAVNEKGDVANDDMEHNDDDGKDDDSDDDGDLAEILQKMEDHGVAVEEEEANRLVIPSNDTAHQTKNEVDGYKTSICEVESRLQIQLSVGENVVATTTNVALAGKIKNHMIQDRTLVVESISHSPASPLASKPLDVGSLLVLKKPCDDKNDPNASWIPLGRIFEVFGPVSQPLYTIRLPPPGPIADQKSSDVKETNDKPLEKDSAGNSDVAEDPAVPKNTSPEKSPEIIDPWAEGGEYTKFLVQSQDMKVYYVQDEAKLIDTSLVLKTSAKGCDASNIHDEEILEPQEEYYSDDEKETKQRKKNSPRKRRNSRPRSKHNHHQNTHAPTMNRHQFHPIPQGMHPRAPPPPPPPRHGNIPPPSTLYQYPAQSLHYRHGGSMPPQAANPPYRSNPNLPNRNPDEPPPYQY